MTNFTNDGESQIFTHAGWQVRIWPAHWTNRIDVTSPFSGADVEISADGVWVNGVSSGTWHDGPRAFTIPWPVIEAIIEARRIVG